jgi:hypothetical protein
MHFYTMTILEETESEYQSELKLWENKDGKIWIQVGYDDNEPHGSHGIPITTDDARALINELSRLLKTMEPPVQEVKQPLGQQLPISKVNWGGK